MTIELLPCPHCGSPASIHTMPNDGNCNDGGQFVMCDNSRCMAASALVFPLMDSAEPLLAERWNRRVAASTAGAIQPHLDHQVGAPVTLSDAASEGWRRIESAPKDATPVLLYVPTRWNKWVPAVQGTGFWYASGWLLPNADEAFQSVSPTHWRPLHSIPRDPTLAASESVEELSTESTRTPLAAPQGGDTGAPSPQPPSEHQT